MSAAAKPKQATDTDHSIGTKIALLRKSQGLSQTALGAAIGVTFQQVQKYEKGANRVGAGRLQAIADLMSVPVSTFFTGGDEAAGSAETTMSVLQVPGALELVKAYGAIADEQLRRDVLALVKSAVRLQAAAMAPVAAMRIDAADAPTLQS